MTLKTGQRVYVENGDKNTSPLILHTPIENDMNRSQKFSMALIWANNDGWANR